MEYTAADESPVRKKVTITATPEEVGKAIDRVVDTYRAQARLDGFRPGKAPRGMVENLFRDKIYGEAVQALYDMQAAEALKALGIKPISHARFEGEAMRRGEPFVYSLSFDIMPDVELPQYEGMRVEQEEAGVDPAEVDAFIERIRNNLATQKPIEENRPPRDGEAALIEFETFDEKGDPIPSMTTTDSLFIVGRAEELKDIDAIVRTLSPGEERRETISFPENFPNAEVAGRALPMRIKVVDLREHVLPALDDALAKRASGHDTVDKMRDAIENSFRARRANAARQKAMNAMMDALLAQTDFPLPEALVEEQAVAYLNDLGERLTRAGKSVKELGKTFEELKAEAEDRARKAVKSQIILTKIADREGIEVTDGDVEAQLARIAERTAQPLPAIRAQAEKDGSIDILRHQLRTDKTIDAIYEKANVVSVPGEQKEVVVVPAENVAPPSPAADTEKE